MNRYVTGKKRGRTYFISTPPWHPFVCSCRLPRPIRASATIIQRLQSQRVRSLMTRLLEQYAMSLGRGAWSDIEGAPIFSRLTLEMPRPLFTPNPRRSHHNPAPAIPANPVPDDQAPKAVRDVSKLGSVVVFWRKVNSPRPDEREARAIPNNRGYEEEEKAIV